MKKSNNLPEKRRKFVKSYIRARKEISTTIKLEQEFTALSTILFVSPKTIRNDYYS